MLNTIARISGLCIILGLLLNIGLSTPDPSQGAPSVATPAPSDPEIPPPAASPPEANLPEANLPEANLPEANLPEANLPEAGIVLLANDDTGVTLALTTPSDAITLERDAANACDRLTLPGAGTSDRAGHPQLPIRSALIGVPPGAEVSLTILDAAPRLLAGSYHLCPVPSPQISQAPTGAFDYRGVEMIENAGAYTANVFTPTVPAEIVMAGYLRDRRVAQIQLHPVQVNAATGQLRYYPYLRVRIDFEQPAPPPHTQSPPTLAGPAARGFDALLARTLINAETAQAWRAAPTTTAVMQPQTPLQATSETTPPYKITVIEDGFYRVTYADLQAAGVPVDTLDPQRFRVQARGQDVAILVEGEDDGRFDPGDSLRFYGQKTTTRYTDANVYWLTWDEPGPRMAQRDVTPSGAAPAPSSFWSTARWEEDRYYQASIPSGAGGDHWFGGLLQAYAGPVSQTYTISLDNIATAPTSPTLRGTLFGQSQFSPSPDHHTRIYLNGHLIDDATWDGWRDYAIEHAVPHTYLVEGDNEVVVELPFDLGGGVGIDTIFVNWFEIDYKDTYVAEDNHLRFTGSITGAQTITVTGFTTGTVALYDVTIPTRTVQLANAAIQDQGGAFSLSFTDALTAGQRFVAQSQDVYKTPESIAQDAPNDLLDRANGADYIIITHPDFYTDVLPLRDHRANQGLRSMVVDVNEVYDAFSYGVFDPQAIRDFLAYAYAHWTPPAPTYVLLVGDGHYDFKNNLNRDEATYIPPYLAYVDPWIGEVAADNRYVCVSGDDILPDLHLGRLPAKTAAEAQAMVDKILTYEQNPPAGAWNRQTLFVADNPDDAGSFHALSNAVADAYLPAPYSAEKIYYKGNYDKASDAKTALLNAINEGRLMVNYIGHASIQFWAFEHIFDLADIATLTNGDKTPFVVPMTCLDGYYIHPSPSVVDISSFGETMVRAAGRGAVASWSPTGLGIATGHDYLNRALYQAIFLDDVAEIGPATTLSKLYLFAESGGYPELHDTYLLFGDPATRLNILKSDVSITKTLTTPGSVLYDEDAITYTLTFTNAGPATAHHVVISDTLPTALTGIQITSSGITATLRPGAAAVWDIADLPAGAGGAITVTGIITPFFDGVLTNTAHITTTAVETNTLNNSATVTATVVAQPRPDLAIDKTLEPAGMLHPGMPITYTLTYTNSGAAPATYVTITDALPGGLVDPQVTLSDAALALRPGSAYVWEIASLPVNGGGTITITATISPTFTGPLTNTATIDTTSLESATANNRATAAASVVAWTTADLRAGVAAEAGVTPHPGDTITYTLTYTNAGPGTAYGVVITNTLSAALTAPRVITAGAPLTLRIGPLEEGSLEEGPLEEVYVWDVADLAPHAGGVITLTGAVAPGFQGPLTSTIMIATTTEDYNPGNNDAHGWYDVSWYHQYLPVILVYGEAPSSQAARGRTR